MPKMGESIMEGTILSWLKKVGDKIEQDESILEVATDKVDTEVPSTHAGVIVEILVKEGDVVPIGKPILVIETEGGSEKASSSPATPAAAAASVSAAAPAIMAAAAIAVSSNGNGVKSDRFYSPLVKNIAKEEGIALQELDHLGAVVTPYSPVGLRIAVQPDGRGRLRLDLDAEHNQGRRGKSWW